MHGDQRKQGTHVNVQITGERLATVHSATPATRAMPYNVIYTQK